MSCENCLARRRSRMKEQQRKSEEEDAEAAIAKHEEDRSPAAGEENLGASAVYRAMADLPRKHSSVWLLAYFLLASAQPPLCETRLSREAQIT